jgi:hypothetical protein
MRDIFTALQSILAPLHGFRKAFFVVEVTCHDILHKLVGFTPLLGRSLCEPGFEMGIEIYFHALQDTEKSVRGQEF